MLVVRPAGPKDYDALLELARASGPGFTSLPEDEPTLRGRLDCSKASFEDSIDREGQWFVLMLENGETGEIDGIAGVKTTVGIKRPFASFRRMNFSHYHVSDDLNVRVDHPALMWVNECRGWSEVGSLFLKPDRRAGGAGSLLARSRYMLIGAQPERFSDWVLAELRGVFDANGKSPFWEHVTSKFFPMDFDSADELSGSGDGQFIFDLAPHHPLYENLMHPEARAAIGQAHAEGVAAKKLLEREGFREIGLVDVFDAGPTMAVQRDAIRTVREAVIRPVRISDAQDGDPQLLSTNSIAGFRCTRASAELVDGVVDISADTAELLKVKEGDLIRVIA
ncbi:arginine N-succinyltransferase [Brevundimonas sp.]|uniref:arginine N-succinyltransferase n=1 Tax=Brevundimonas sp. TaxID=1871086 RepID=UPI0025D5A2F7|nr:arginine N-succinyltransferase [Brevundimonas sp.]